MDQRWDKKPGILTASCVFPLHPLPPDAGIGLKLRSHEKKDERQKRGPFLPLNF